ncbi:hypothetical protein K488DRAFT_90988 [Vararia minispora EC-137]|uniref:Uncharacterized protein n=1 Tax=Vararia minispora EC-137 TaxID=1314806 RepID=A0ACB8Q6L1_9AGAM|nr:hypothetical protein K488DRAFT_90988 [Vararia minispora EC-137]
MIVIPCARCTSSVAGTSRATNGHRFVFHSAEITPHERRYVPGESGVLPLFANELHSFLSTSPELDLDLSPHPDSPPPLIPDSPASPSPPLLRTIHRRTHPLSGHPSLDTSTEPDDPDPPEPKVTAQRTLRSGETLFWHHLARAGEIPGVRDDRRARVRSAVWYDR